MATPFSVNPLSKSEKPRNLRRVTPLMLALIVQATLLFVTGFIVVVLPPRKAEPEFKARPTVFLPQRELEHRVALAEFQQVTAAPPSIERLTSSLLMPDGLPTMTTLPFADFHSMNLSESVPVDSAALAGASALLGAGGKSNESAASFFGIEDSGERIVIIVNTSVSVVRKAAARGVTIDRIQEEMTHLIDGLEASTLFGIVQFSQGVRLFTDFLAPATQANKEAVRSWIPTNLRGNPRARPDQRYYGHEAAFEAALALSPDLIFLLTDGQLNRREGSPGNYRYPEIPFREFLGTLRNFEHQADRDVRIHVVGFEMKPNDAEQMRALTRAFGGEVRAF